MSQININEISNEYFNFVKENTKMTLLSNDHTEIVTPFVDSTGEGISFSITFDGNLYTLSDDGFAAWELALNGIDVSKKSKRKTIFISQIEYNGFDLDESDNVIHKKVTKNELGQAIHDMTQLLINIYDLTYLSRSNVYQQFYEDVREYFIENESFAVFPEFNLTGKSHFNHKFNYVFLQKGTSKLTKVYNTLNRQQVDSILTSWLDTSESRRNNYNGKEELYIILSSEGFNNLSDDFILALQSYEIGLLDFSDKDNLINKLGA